MTPPALTTYQKRIADELYESMKNNHSCILLSNTRQCGKTMIRLNVIRRLHADGLITDAVLKTLKGS